MPRPGDQRELGPQATYLPTPEEIEAGTAEIRVGWRKATLASRRQFPGPIPWYAPELEVVVERELPVA